MIIPRRFYNKDSYLFDFSYLLGFGSFISGIFIPFTIKDILKIYSDNNEMIISYNSFLTIFTIFCTLIT